MTLRSIRTILLIIMSGDSQLHQSQALAIIYHLFCLLSPSSHALANSLPRASLFSACLLFKIRLSLNSFQWPCTHFCPSVCVLLMQHIFSFCCLLTSFLHPGVCSAVVLPRLSSARPHTHPIPTYSSLSSSDFNYCFLS